MKDFFDVMTVGARAIRIMRSLVDEWPSECPLCHLSSRAGQLCPGCLADCYGYRQQRAVCAKCADDINIGNACDCNGLATHQLICPSCQSRSLFVDSTTCALDYQFPAQLLLDNFMLAGQLSLAPVHAKLMVMAAEPVLKAVPIDVWIPIPCQSAKLVSIGYSPSQQLARVMARLTGIPYRLTGLRYAKAWGAGQGRAGGAAPGYGEQDFVADPMVYGLAIGLVIDLSGKNDRVDSAAKALRVAGARNIIVVAAARQAVNCAGSAPSIEACE